MTVDDFISGLRRRALADQLDIARLPFLGA